MQAPALCGCMHLRWLIRSALILRLKERVPEVQECVCVLLIRSGKDEI
ncbi:hypothetical protein X773_09560 [Mesorhizobium sp. LSJC285A00]|nr:hypothetical protein X773_09560 [Mesorhizobium sp. LSJC285A00]ESY15009.1 hypothetical protein X750_29835 [Mesorhizobium sp. LNJC394B00]